MKRFVGDLPAQRNVRPVTADDARALAEPFGTPTSLGNYGFVSTVKNLSTALTVYLGSPRVQAGAYTQKKKDIIKDAPDTLRRVHAYLERAPLVQLDCAMGENSDFALGCRFYLSTYRKDSIRLAHMAGRNLFPSRDDLQPDLAVILVPEWPEKDRQVLVFPELGVTYILGSDYFGELKNAYLRMAMWRAKQEGMLGLHAGTQILQARRADGSLRRLGMIMFGIAATGKTTHSCHDHGLDTPGEGVRILQDDVVFWRRDGSALGSERAFYIKTDALVPEEQPALYSAAVQRDTILENITVDFQGNPDFLDRTLTANAHAIAQRSDLGLCGEGSVNLLPLAGLDGLIMAFMVRDYTVTPILSKLNADQAAAAYMLSESIDASGSDQPAAPSGISASPLIIGDAAEECNIFHDLLRAHGDKIECYMLNTGGVGEIVEHGLDGARKVRQKVTRIQIPEMSAVIRALARGGVTWRDDADWMVETPAEVDGLDIATFDLHRHYDQDRIDFLIAQTRIERAAYAEQLPDLSAAIRRAVEM